MEVCATEQTTWSLVVKMKTVKDSQSLDRLLTDEFFERRFGIAQQEMQESARRANVVHYSLLGDEGRTKLARVRDYVLREAPPEIYAKVVSIRLERNKKDEAYSDDVEGFYNDVGM